MVRDQYGRKDCFPGEFTEGSRPLLECERSGGYGGNTESKVVKWYTWMRLRY